VDDWGEVQPEGPSGAASPAGEACSGPRRRLRLLDPLNQRGPPPQLLPENRGRPCPGCCAPVLMVRAEPEEVERELAAGRLCCPTCDGELRPWSFARPRQLRGREGPVPLRPRRSRCRRCGITHVLLPVLALLRRRDVRHRSRISDGLVAYRKPLQNSLVHIAYSGRVGGFSSAGGRVA
jgi:hypothetical protein